MYEGGVTPVLEAWLVTRGDIKRPVGAGSLMNERAGRSHDGAHPQVAEGRVNSPPHTGQAGEDSAKPILIWNNPNMTSAAVRRTSRAALAIVGA